MGNITNTEELAASMAKANAQAALVYTPAPQLAPPPTAAQAAQAALDIILARPLAVREYDYRDTVITTSNLAQYGGGQNHQAVLPALENEIRAQVVVLAPQQGRRLTPSIIQSIVDAVKNDYSRNNYNYGTHAWTNLSASRRTIPGFVNQFAPLITQNFSNTTKLEPFWNVTQTRAESVRNAECNNNTLPIGVYLSNNMSMYASIKY